MERDASKASSLLYDGVRTALRTVMERLPLADLASALVTAIRGLGQDSQLVRELFSNSGMPSEYRSGLFAALNEAQKFLKLRRSSAARKENQELLRLAEDIVQLVHAIIFAMKHGMPYENIMRVSVELLTSQLCSLGLRESTWNSATH